MLSGELIIVSNFGFVYFSHSVCVSWTLFVFSVIKIFGTGELIKVLNPHPSKQINAH
jgi:hypothetical protein